MYNWIILLHTWNEHNIVNQLLSQYKIKIKLKKHNVRKNKVANKKNRVKLKKPWWEIILSVLVSSRVKLPCSVVLEVNYYEPK